MNEQESELISRAQENKEEFNAIYQEYAPKIYGYLWRRVGHDKDIAEDLLQETFVRAYARLPLFELRQGRYLSYLFTIAHNLLVNYYRAPKTLSLEVWQKSGFDLAAWYEKKDRATKVDKILKELSESEKLSFFLRYYGDMEIREIAHMLQKSENAVKLLLSRARKKVAGHPMLYT